MRLKDTWFFLHSKTKQNAGRMFSYRPCHDAGLPCCSPPVCDQFNEEMRIKWSTMIFWDKNHNLWYRDIGILNQRSHWDMIFNHDILDPYKIVSFTPFFYTPVCWLRVKTHQIPIEHPATAPRPGCPANRKCPRWFAAIVSSKPSCDRGIFCFDFWMQNEIVWVCRCIPFSKLLQSYVGYNLWDWKPN